MKKQTPEHTRFFQAGMVLPDRPPAPDRPLSVGEAELARVGIPARKIPRVLAELRRQAAACPALDRPGTLCALARQIARRLL